MFLFQGLYSRTVEKTAEKGVSGLKQKKWVLDLRISLDIKFQLKLMI